MVLIKEIGKMIAIDIPAADVSTKRTLAPSALAMAGAFSNITTAVMSMMAMMSKLMMILCFIRLRIGLRNENKLVIVNG